MSTSETAAFLGFGSVQFQKAIDQVPFSSETSGNVTINNSGSPGIPSYFEVTFMLSSNFDKDGLTQSNIFHLKSLVTGKSADASYAEIESEAARQIAPTFRQIADALEAQVVEFDRKANSETQ